jgi:LmbE family N-acetylglucosaminyl deacetylase
MTIANPLFHPTALPLRSSETIAGSALIVAPHPDDETLGCGGAIALLRILGYPVHILVMSDGTLSHPRSLKYPAPKLRSLRQAETQEALEHLGVQQTEVTFLQLPDGSIPTPESSEFQSALHYCCRYLESRTFQTVFLPWRSDPHPDHRATWTLLKTALATFNPKPRLIEYPIWDWDLEQRGAFTQQVTGWRLDIQAVVEKKRTAIAAYRSQTTNLIDDDPEGFQLTPEMLVNFTHPWELYLEEIL